MFDESLLWLSFANSNSSTTELMSGTYSLDGADGYLFACESDSDGSYGTMFAQGDGIIVGATDGSVVVSKNGDKYTFNCDFWDSESETRYTATYTGALTYVDYSTATASTKVAYAVNNPRVPFAYRPVKAKKASTEKAVSAPSARSIFRQSVRK